VLCPSATVTYGCPLFRTWWLVQSWRGRTTINEHRTRGSTITIPRPCTMSAVNSGHEQGKQLFREGLVRGGHSLTSTPLLESTSSLQATRPSQLDLRPTGNDDRTILPSTTTPSRDIAAPDDDRTIPPSTPPRDIAAPRVQPREADQTGAKQRRIPPRANPQPGLSYRCTATLKKQEQVTR